MTLSDNDRSYRFIFENTDVRGELVHLDATWRAVLERKQYPQPVRDLLGQAMAAAALLSATIRKGGALHLQLQGGGPVSLLLVEISAQRTLRALARYSDEAANGSFAELVGKAQISLTIDPGAGQDRYQGLIAVEQDSLAAALEDYFIRSEQLKTRLWLAAGETRVGGMLLQLLPGDRNSEEDWNRDVFLGETLSDDELLSLSTQDLLHRLFHQEDLRLFEPEPLGFRCSCSRERIESMLRGLGYNEVHDILEEQKKVQVNCEYCNQDYSFDRVDIEHLFAASDQPEVPTTRH